MRRDKAYLLGLGMALLGLVASRNADAQVADGSEVAPAPVEAAPAPVEAAPAPVEAAPAPTVAWQEPARPFDSSVHNHDGFFLRMDLGFGPGWYSEEYSGTETSAATGFTGMFALQLGGTLFPGFVLGGGIVGNSMVEPKFEDKASGNTYDSDVSLGLSEFQIFAAYYPIPNGGLHFLASAGYGSLSMSVDDSTHDLNMSGLVLGGGIGYDFWVSSQWSLGPMLAVTHGMLNGTEDNEDYSSTFTAPTIAFTATYH